MMRLLQTTLLLLITSTPLFAASRPSNLFSARQTSKCADPPRDSCAFYADCLESHYHCGLNGYPIGYGQTVCEEYSKGRGEMSEQGQKWTSDMTLCLQKVLVPEATGRVVGATCDSIKTKGYASHVPCYIDSGICQLPGTDWLKIVKNVGLYTLDKGALTEALATTVGCELAYPFFLENLV